MDFTELSNLTKEQRDTVLLAVQGSGMTAALVSTYRDQLLERIHDLELVNRLIIDFQRILWENVFTVEKK